MNEKDPKKNPEGYLDLTAYEAVRNADAELYRFKSLMSIIHKICNLAGYQVEGKITVRNKKTGKIWR